MRNFIRRTGIFPFITGVVLLAITAFAVMYGERLNPFDGKTWSDFDSQNRTSES